MSAPALALLLLAQAPPAPAPDPAEVVLARNIQARGGEAKLRAVKTLRMTGYAALLPNTWQVPYREEERLPVASGEGGQGARPAARRKEIEIQGMTEVDVFDGAQAWTWTPWATGRELQMAKPENLHFSQEEERGWSLILDHKARGIAAVYLGKDLFEGVPVQVVRFTVSPSTEVTCAFDARTWQEIRRDQVWRDLGNEIHLVTTYDNFKTVQGLTFPFFVERRAEHRGSRDRLTLERIDLNPPLPDTRFAKPQARRR